MRMMVFDRRTCRWRPWHGSRAAWLKLPHAVATSVCVLSAATVLALPPRPPRPPGVPAPRPPVTAPVSTDLPSVLAFVPPNPFSPLAGPGFSGAGASQTPPSLPKPEPGTPPVFSSIPTPGENLWSLNDPGTTIPRVPDLPVVPTTPVPEPGSLMLLAGAVFLLAAARRVDLPRPIQRKAAGR